MINNHVRFAAVKAAAVVMMAAAVAPVSGCGKGDRIETYPVTGKVTFSDDKPLPGGEIVFLSLDHEITAKGRIEPNGTVSQLTTYEPGDGAVAGLHRVVIIPPMRTDVDEDDEQLPELIHPRFQNPETTDLKFTVSEDGPREFSFHVEGP